MKHFICCIVFSLASSLLAAEKPNVLFIIVDDLTTTLSSYGDKDSRTPSMDALAADGVRFTKAYTQFALCNPSRASFLTGCYPERTKVFDLTVNFRDALPNVVTLPELFQKAGYVTGSIGKVFHVGGPKEKLNVQMPAPLHLDGVILDEVKLAQATEGDLSDPGQGKGKHGKNYNKPFGPSDRPEKEFTDYEIAERAIHTLEGFKAEGGKPFYLAVGFIRPHTPYVAPRPYFDKFDPKAIAMPPFYQQGGENLKQIPVAALRPNNNVFSIKAPDLTEAREARRAYLAACAWVDSQVGRVLAKLKELNLKDNTIVVLTGDHGYQLGEHGLWAKQTLFEGATHVPLIVSAPGVKPATCDGLVEQVDILPTIAGLAGLKAPSTVQGRSLQRLLDDPKGKSKEVVYSTMVSTHTKLIGHSVRTDRFRYIEWDEGKGGEQLYDYETDPDELHNLIAKPMQTDRLKRMRARLAAHLKAVAAQGE